MERFVYLFLSLAFFVVWLGIYLVRKDLRKALLTTGVVGLLAGPIVELWYFQDYWHPVSLIGTFPIIEDAIFGFSLCGVSVTIFDVLTNQKITAVTRIRKKIFIYIFIILSFIFLLVFNNFLKINSIFVSSSTFLFFATYLLLKRPKLIVRSLLSGIGIALIAVVIYCVLFNIIAPQYWHEHWLLAATPFGITVLGNIPLTEIIWFFTWGCLAGIGYIYVTEKR